MSAMLDLVILIWGGHVGACTCSPTVFPMAPRLPHPQAHKAYRSNMAKSVSESAELGENSERQCRKWGSEQAECNHARSLSHDGPIRTQRQMLSRGRGMCTSEPGVLERGFTCGEIDL